MRKASITRNGSGDANADAALAKMGYASELPRNLSMLSILGMSFAIMAVPFGLSTTLYITLTWSIGHDIVGMGSGIADFSRYCCTSCGNLCGLSHCWRSLLLVSHAFN